MSVERVASDDLIHVAPESWFVFQNVRTRQRAFLCLGMPRHATAAASRDGELYPIIALDSDPRDTCPLHLLWPVPDASVALQNAVMEWAREFMTDHPIVTMVAIGKDGHDFVVGVGVASLEWDSPDAAAWPALVAGLRVVRFNHIITQCAGVRPGGPLPPRPCQVVRTPGAVLSSPIGPMTEDGWFFTAGVVAVDDHNEPHLVSVGHGVRGEEDKPVVFCPENYRTWVHRDAFLNASASGQIVAAAFRQSQSVITAWDELPAADRGHFLAYPPPPFRSPAQVIGNVVQSSMRRAHGAFVFEYSVIALDPGVAAAEEEGHHVVATSVWDPDTPLPGLPSAIGATTGRVDCLELRGRSATHPLTPGAMLGRMEGGPFENVLVLNRGDGPALRKGDSGACLFKETAGGHVIAIGILGQTDPAGNAYFFPLSPILACSNLRIP